jgi:hypothetical protein
MLAAQTGIARRRLVTKCAAACRHVAPVLVGEVAISSRICGKLDMLTAVDEDRLDSPFRTIDNYRKEPP